MVSHASMAATHVLCVQLLCVLGVLPRTHGSALFTRGETASASGCNASTGRDESSD